MNEALTACILIILMWFMFWAGYEIRGVVQEMDCSRDNTVVIHKGVRR